MRLSHGKSATSAFWSPSGNALLSTSMDNLIRVWRKAEGSDSWDWANPLRIRHNNQTGRWVTSFRAVWMAEDAFVIGSMERRSVAFNCIESSAARHSSQF